MVKAKTKIHRKPSVLEMDSVFIFKLILFLILGSQWLHIMDTGSNSEFPIPVGALTGLAFALHDHFKIDRKIEYTILLLAMFIGFWLPMGITVVR